jgi:hypothetical protein
MSSKLQTYIVYERDGVNLRPLADFLLPSAQAALEAFREIYGDEHFTVIALPLVAGDAALELGGHVASLREKPYV